MDSDEKKPGGGAGGGAEDHQDIRQVDGTFFREAHDISLVTDPRSSYGMIAVYATGASSAVHIMGEERAVVRTRGKEFPDSALPADLFSSNGIVIFAPDGSDHIIIRRGASDGDQTIELKPDGGIVVDAGMSGYIILEAGESKISITPEFIKITAPLVKIN
jgi:hypothetical protein